jgi:predicted  nucleic acid-binding Zn-ribbon protein
MSQEAESGKRSFGLNTAQEILLGVESELKAVEKEIAKLDDAIKSEHVKTKQLQDQLVSLEQAPVDH